MQKKIDDSTITVPVPSYSEVKIGTLQSIIRQSGLPRSLFEWWQVSDRTIPTSLLPSQPKTESGDCKQLAENFIVVVNAIAVVKYLDCDR
jgi:hypothetical protein